MYTILMQDQQTEKVHDLLRAAIASWTTAQAPDATQEAVLNAESAACRTSFTHVGTATSRDF